MTKSKIAVVGSGISGLSAAWLLAKHHHVTVYEAANYAGGHSNTVDVTLNGISHPVDTGFLVHNDRTYPNLIALFKHIGIDTPASDMSFSVKLPHVNVEWAGATLGTLFAQKRNLFRPSFWRMIRDILNFNKRAHDLLASVQDGDMSLGQLLDREGYSREFREWYLLPMGAAIWSSPMDDMADFPAKTFIQFCLNHGLLQINDRPQWKSIRGGSRVYVERLCADIRAHDGHVLLNTPVQQVTRHADGVHIATANGVDVFDQVVMACHTDQSLALLTDAHAQEKAVLAAVRYQPNTAYLHTDENLMPMRKSAWSAWNYYAGASQAGEFPVAVTYWLNRLQPLPFDQAVMVTLNPPEPPKASETLAVIDYAHPLLDGAAYQAQQALPSIQGLDRVYFAGAWASYGFHEDGLKSGLAVANLLGVYAPWQNAEDQSLERAA
ncbi:putative NAD/FAD-binding protein [Paraperlucidibaca baekdonensis]|uniref:Putative NAD/FAD-binding protein n=1 Tax=Paraperlucidibaca baekdonensis TaxID=748120 RepID=A0A3E0H3I7_9GAMM|nr:FAD-dependent oxidoreductase [Paraperlucidibaca baekdonensis]REH36815.1 putative NAD/FAD-binding protein [Paraperlucidibaca baekdonensis]